MRVQGGNGDLNSSAAGPSAEGRGAALCCTYTAGRLWLLGELPTVVLLFAMLLVLVRLIVVLKALVLLVKMLKDFGAADCHIDGSGASGHVVAEGRGAASRGASDRCPAS